MHCLAATFPNDSFWVSLLLEPLAYEDQREYQPAFSKMRYRPRNIGHIRVRGRPPVKFPLLSRTARTAEGMERMIIVLLNALTCI